MVAGLGGDNRALEFYWLKFFLKLLSYTKCLVNLSFVFSFSTTVNKFRILLTSVLMADKKRVWTTINQTQFEKYVSKKFVTFFYSNYLVNAYGKARFIIPIYAQIISLIFVYLHET